MEPKPRKAPGPWPLRLGRRCEEVGPELGRLHEARHVLTGKPALMLTPSDRVVWQPDGGWRVVLRCEPTPTSLSLYIEQAPSLARMSELANILALMKDAVEGVEDSAQANAHLAARPVSLLSRWTPRALAGLSVLTLGLGLWPYLEPSHPPDTASSVASLVRSPPNAMKLVKLKPAGPSIPSYPLPDHPFRNQAVAPCNKKGVVEINGGCWVEIAQKPPCNDDEAEYKGKCYLPGAKLEDRPPQAVQP